MSIETELNDRSRAVVRIVARAAAGVVGPAGLVFSAIEKLFAGGAARLVETRVALFLEELRAEFVRLGATDFPEQYLESQDFAHLVMRAVEAVAKERDAEKRRTYAHILVNGTLPPWDARPESVEEAIRSLAELTVTDFQVLRALIEDWRTRADRGERGSGITKFKASDLQPLLPGFDPNRLQPYLARLQRTGLVVASTGTWNDLGDTFTTTPLLSDLAILIYRGRAARYLDAMPLGGLAPGIWRPSPRSPPARGIPARAGQSETYRRKRARGQGGTESADPHDGSEPAHTGGRRRADPH